MIEEPRCEGDQEVNIPELNLNDATKGNEQNVPLLDFSLPHPIIEHSFAA